MEASIEKYFDKAITLLQQLIATPSLSKEEDKTASLLELFFQKNNIQSFRKGNNVYVFGKKSSNRKTLLLNSHHDTVKPSSSYTKNPFEPIIEDGKLYGLGSNDAGASLVSLAVTFLYFIENDDCDYNLVFAGTAEEEISGKNGIESLIPELGTIDCAIVGEPTLMQMAVAERGLMVVDGLAKGQSGHSARNEGVNALYKAIEDIEKLRNLKFEKISNLLGAVSLNTTAIHTANKQHNVIPDTCEFVIDVRLNELYTMEEIFSILQSNVTSELNARSMRLKSTMIDLEHPLVKRGMEMGLKHYGSPTLSDKALMPFPALKIGPGDSARSHTADEFVYVEEIKKGIKTYIELLKK